MEFRGRHKQGSSNHRHRHEATSRRPTKARRRMAKRYIDMYINTIDMGICIVVNYLAIAMGFDSEDDSKNSSSSALASPRSFGIQKCHATRGGDRSYIYSDIDNAISKDSNSSQVGRQQPPCTATPHWHAEYGEMVTRPPPPMRTKNIANSSKLQYM